MKKYLPKFEDGDKVPTSQGATIDSGLPVSKLPGPEQALMAAGAARVSADLNPQKYFTTTIKTKPQKTDDEGNPKGLSEKGQKGLGIAAQATSMITDMASSAIDVDENSSFGAEQALGDALMSSGNPYAMAAGAAVKTMSMISQATGTNVNTISKKEASEAGISGFGRIANNVLGFASNIGLLGPGVGALIGKTENVKMSEQTRAMSNAYAGSVDTIDTAEGMSGGRYFVGRDKINAMILDADRKNRLITDISVTNTQRKASDYGLDLAQQNLNRYAGNNYQNMHVGKHGMKLASVYEIRQLLALRKNDDENIQSFHNGGVIGIDVNVIPEGKYHAHKNHLGEISEEFEDLTKKGIPVVAHAEGGEIEQVAEIEKMEIIFRLEVTEKLEELAKDGSEEAMIEAGKLVAYEIIENTQDNSGEVLGDE
jgi:hypothetical protein